MPEPMWRWCAMPGASRDTRLNVDINAYGDGYVHRSTRGLNPARPSWSVQCPFKSASEFAAMDQFLRDHAAGGFYFEPPDGGGATVFVTVDQWSAQIADRHDSRTAEDIVGTLSATFEQAFNPQPISPVVLASGGRNAFRSPLAEQIAARRLAALTAEPEPVPIGADGVIQPSPTTPFPDVPQQPPEAPTNG